MSSRLKYSEALPLKSIQEEPENAKEIQRLDNFKMPEQKLFQPSSISNKVEEAGSHCDVSQLKAILHGVDDNSKRNVLNNTTINGRSLLSYAAVNGHLELVQYLLDNGTDPSIASSSGRTALHEAIQAGFPDVVRVLLQHGSRDETDGLARDHQRSFKRRSISMLALESLAIVNLQDEMGLTPMLVLFEAHSLTSEQFTSLVKILIENGANVEYVLPGSGQTILFRAVEMHSQTACTELVRAGASVDVQDTVGDTVLHLSARLDLPNILQWFLQCSKQSVNKQNKRGETPLHCAAIAGSRECLNVLLNFGGDLSVEDGNFQTVLDVIFSHLPRPSSFLLEILNSKVMSNGCALNDRRFQLTLDFRVLSPDRSRQMSVVVALMNALHKLDRKNVLAHPLIEVYLRAKWRRMRVFFFVLAFIHLLFVVSLSAHVVLNLHPEDLDSVTWSRRILLGTAFILITHVTVQTALAPRYFLQEAETWLSLTCVCLAFIVSLSGELLDNGDWMRHVASVTVLLGWGQVMFILGRFPAVGFFALMFFTVLKNVIKVLLIAACLVIGFALSFCIQFNNFDYEGVGRAIIRTTVMLMGEYQYDSLFPNQSDLKNRAAFDNKYLKPRTGPTWEKAPIYLPTTSYLIFLLFILLGSVVLMNLTIGLAVNDIQGLKAEGTLRHMIKQAEFLFHIDSILSRSNFFQARKTTPAMVTISPNTTNKMRKVHYNMLGLSIPIPVMEGLISIALRNERKGSNVSAEEHNAFLNNRLGDCDFQVRVVG